MTLATEAPSVILFTPSRSLPFFDDEGTGDVSVYYGEVFCPGCHHIVPVQAEEDRTETGVCCRLVGRLVGRDIFCETRITVMVDPDHWRRRPEVA